MRILYLARRLTFKGVELGGRSLVQYLASEHQVRVCALVVAAADPLLNGAHASNVVAVPDLGNFDVVIAEGGWNPSGAEPRVPPEAIDTFVASGGQLIVADVTLGAATKNLSPLLKCTDLLGTQPHLVGGALRYLRDPGTADTSDSQRFVPSEMRTADSLRPVWDGIESVLTIDAIELLPTAEVLASGHHSTRALIKDLVVDEPSQWPWATVSQRGRGHVAVIGAGVTDDSLIEACPDNARWISNIAALLVRLSAEFKRATPGYRTDDGAVTSPFASHVLGRVVRILAAEPDGLGLEAICHRLRMSSVNVEAKMLAQLLQRAGRSARIFYVPPGKFKLGRPTASPTSRPGPERPDPLTHLASRLADPTLQFLRIHMTSTTREDVVLRADIVDIDDTPQFCITAHGDLLQSNSGLRATGAVGIRHWRPPWIPLPERSPLSALLWQAKDATTCTMKMREILRVVDPDGCATLRIDPWYLTKREADRAKDQFVKIGKYRRRVRTDRRVLNQCAHCDRDLTDPESAARGVGPVCAKHYDREFTKARRRLDVEPYLWFGAVSVHNWLADLADEYRRGGQRG